jgi:hypothetical protein
MRRFLPLQRILRNIAFSEDKTVLRKPAFGFSEIQSKGNSVRQHFSALTLTARVWIFSGDPVSCGCVFIGG